MESVLNAALMDSGDIPIGEVVSVTPQSVHSETGMRGYRIDVEAKTSVGEIALLEVQLKPFAGTIERSLLYGEQSLARLAKRGEALAVVTGAMPRVIIVNILENALRKDGGFHQVVEFSYREPPRELATDRFQIHNLELSKFRKLDSKTPANALYCWLSAICRAQDTKKSLAEVVKMDAILQEYCNQDEGFAQFVQRHGIVAATPEVRRAYRLWEFDIMMDKLEENRRTLEENRKIAEGEAKGKAEGKAEGRQDEKREKAKKMKAADMPVEAITRFTGLTADEIDKL
jgi:predicted transposase/invertase (TIGR01784 family)